MTQPKYPQTTKVIAFKNQPVRLPMWATIGTYLLMDKIAAPQWAWGAVGCVFVIVWIASIVSICKQTQVDIFEEKP